MQNFKQNLRRYDIHFADHRNQESPTETNQSGADLVHESHLMSSLLEPVLMEDNENSILYSDVMRTGIAV